MTQTNCARCFSQLSRRELLRESLLCHDCERRLLAKNVEHEELRQLALDNPDFGDQRMRQPDRAFD